MQFAVLPGDTAENASVDQESAERAPWAIWLAVLGHVVGAALIVGYAAFLILHFQPAISEPDDNGYFAQGSLMATKGTTILKPESDAQYIGMHWLITADPKINGANSVEQYISRYPPGLPALIAVVYKIGGYKAAAAVNPALAIGALIGLYLLICRVAPVPFALGGVVLVAMNPTFTHHALDGDSHMGVTFCLLWAIYFMLLWSKGRKLWQAAAAGIFLGCIPTVRYGDVVMEVGVAVFFLWRSRIFRLAFPYLLAAVLAWTLCAKEVFDLNHGNYYAWGICGAMLVAFLWQSHLLTRLGPHLALAIHHATWFHRLIPSGLRQWAEERAGDAPTNENSGYFVPRLWLHLLVAGAAAIIPVLPMLIRNQIVMGRFWRTGYTLTNEESGFSMAFFKAHAVEYLQQVQGTGIGLFFGLGLVGMVWMICVKRTRALGSLLLLATASMLILYMAYYWAPQMNSQMTMRFLLPTFPLYVIAGAWVLAEALRQAPMAARIVVPIAVVAVQLAWGTNTMWQETVDGTYQRQLLATVSEALQKNVPVGAVVLTDGHTLQDLDFVRIWKTADESLLHLGGGGDFMGGGGNNRGRGGRAGRGGGGGGGGRNFMGADPNAPSPRQEEKSEVASAKYTGDTDERVQKFESDLRKWAGGNTFYFVGTQEQLDQTFRELGELGHVGVFARIPLPPEPAAPQREGLMGAAMPGGPGGMAGAFIQIGRRRGGGGGMFGSALAGEKEIVIAQWKIPDS